MFGVAERGKAEQRADGRQAGVACPGAVVLWLSRCSRNAPMSGASRSARSSSCRRAAGPFRRKMDEQPDGVAIAATVAGLASCWRASLVVKNASRVEGEVADLRPPSV